MDCNLPGSSAHEIFQARILEWVAMPSSRGSSQPRHQTLVSCIAGSFFTDWATRKLVFCVCVCVLLYMHIYIYVFGFDVFSIDLWEESSAKSLCISRILNQYIFCNLKTMKQDKSSCHLLCVRFWNSKYPLIDFHCTQIPYYFCNLVQVFCKFWASQAALVVKNLPANAGDIRDEGSIPGSRTYPWEGNGNPLQYSCLENPHGQRSLAVYSPWGLKELDTEHKFYLKTTFEVHKKWKHSLKRFLFLFLFNKKEP